MMEEWVDVTDECVPFGPYGSDHSRLDIGIAYHTNPIIKIDDNPYWKLRDQFSIRKINGAFRIFMKRPVEAA